MKAFETLNNAVNARAEAEKTFNIDGWLSCIFWHLEPVGLGVFKEAESLKKTPFMRFELKKNKAVLTDIGGYSENEAREVKTRLFEIMTFDEDSEARNEKRQANELEAQVADDFCQHEHEQEDFDE